MFTREQRRSVSQGSARKTACEKMKKRKRGERKRKTLLLPRFFYCFACCYPQCVLSNWTPARGYFNEGIRHWYSGPKKYSSPTESHCPLCGAFIYQVLREFGHENAVLSWVFGPNINIDHFFFSHALAWIHSKPLVDSLTMWRACLIKRRRGLPTNKIFALNKAAFLIKVCLKTYTTLLQAALCQKSFVCFFFHDLHDRIRLQEMISFSLAGLLFWVPHRFKLSSAQ